MHPDACQAVRGDTHDAFAKPLQAEDEQQGADYEPEWTDRRVS
jgi:hypothetical protein